MFERRIKTLGIILAAVTILLFGRLVQVQVFGKAHYRELAADVMTQSKPIATSRGTIRDIRGNVIAEDQACIDAAVDFRVVTRDTEQKQVKDYIARLAGQRVRARTDINYAAADAETRKSYFEEEKLRVRDDIDRMWHTLAKISGQSIEDIEDARTRIETEVRVKKRQITFRRYRSAVQDAETREAPAWYHRWLTAGVNDELTEDQFDDDPINEQVSPHVILRALTPDQQNELGRNLDKLPGLVLQPSTHRVYPYRNNAAHVIGYLTRVQPEHLTNDPEAENDLRSYGPNDLAGRDGIEALAERVLRGTRGQEENTHAEWTSTKRIDPIKGGEVICTLDMELQSTIREAFVNGRLKSPEKGSTETRATIFHGAAVVIDIPTNEVRALVSFPDFDLNNITQTMADLQRDDGGRPLFHRATMSQLEPGSTVKPVVGIAAMAADVASVDERLECTGYLTIRGKRLEKGGRCWTQTIDDIGHPHHNVPYSDPHTGPTPDLNGHLNFPEAIERSCNVFFENMADRLGSAGLAVWMQKFGLGRYTGIGIAEARGRVPRRVGPAGIFSTWIAGIGQGDVNATPLQIANAMATIGRGGIWMKPKIVRDLPVISPWQGSGETIPDRIDLKIEPEVIAAAKRGMTNAVVRQAGSAHEALSHLGISVAAKTGTAQAAPFRLPKRDENGKLLLTEDGRKQWTEPRRSTWSNPNPQFPWYHASDENAEKINHAWIVGFAPAENPKIAFAVMIEYAGSGGGTAAGPVAAQLLEACVEHGYVAKKK